MSQENISSIWVPAHGTFPTTSNILHLKELPNITTFSIFLSSYSLLTRNLFESLRSDGIYKTMIKLLFARKMIDWLFTKKSYVKDILALIVYLKERCVRCVVELISMLFSLDFVCIVISRHFSSFQKLSIWWTIFCKIHSIRFYTKTILNHFFRKKNLYEWQIFLEPALLESQVSEAYGCNSISEPVFERHLDFHDMILFFIPEAVMPI